MHVLQNDVLKVCPVNATFTALLLFQSLIDQFNVHRIHVHRIPVLYVSILSMFSFYVHDALL